jgi:phosphatidylinositol kinase/protein kinase (PI-3  family)
MSKTLKAVKQEVVVNQLNSAALNTKLTNAIAIREYWSANEELRSNMKLYDILSRCYEVYDEYMSAKDKRQWKADFYDAISKINEKFTANKVDTKLTLTIVRVVFGDSDMCRKRVSTYAKVLRVAGDNASEKRVKASELAEWIAARGGVQEVSKSEAARVRETTDKVAHVQKRLRTLGSVAKIDSLNSVDLVGNYAVMLVSIDDDAMTVKHVFKDAEFVNSVLRRLYSEYKSKDESHENTNCINTASVAKLSDQSSDFQKLAA